MGIFFFLIIAGIIVFLIVQRQGNVAGEWEQAADRLRLNYSRGGLVNPHWIYGKKAGLRYDIKTFNRSTGNAGNQKWTGYRVRFHRSANIRIRVTESARSQLTRRFQECEIDEDGIFCARPGVESDAPSIIDNVERLQSVTAKLLAAAEEEEKALEAAEPAGSPPPPPPMEDEPEKDEPSAESEAKESEPVFELAGNDVETEAEPIPVAEPVVEKDDEEEFVLELDSEPEEPLVRAEPADGEEEDEDEEVGDDLTGLGEVSPEPAMTLAAVSHDLFDSGRNHFQITQRFDTEYHGLSMMGEGKLLRSEPYSNDRVFGRGPGTLAEIEIDEPEEPLAGHHTIRAVLQLPETTTARSLREKVGDTVTISGTMIRCDAFDGRIFLESGELA